MTEQVPQSAVPGAAPSGSAAPASYPAASGTPASASAASTGAAAGTSPASASGTTAGTYASGTSTGTYASGTTAGDYASGTQATGYASNGTASSYPSSSTAGTYSSGSTAGTYSSGSTAGAYPSGSATGSYTSGSSASSYPSASTAGSYPASSATSGYPASSATSGYASTTQAATYPTSASTGGYASASPTSTYTAASSAQPGATTPLPPVTPAAHGYVQPYGSVAAAQAETKKRNTLLGVIIGLLIVILLAGAGTAFVFMSGILDPPKDPVEEVPRAPLTDDQVIAAFDAATLPAPNLAQYAYVSQDALTGPKFSDIVVNEPMGTTVAAGQVIECTALATATFQNKSIEIAAPVTLPFEYDPNSQTWVPGQLVVGDLVTTPLSSASAPEIVANLNKVLTDYDAAYGESMADATVVKTAADLTIDGGTIVVDLTKTVETAQEDKTINELRTCTVTLNVSWDNNKGWLVKVTDAGKIDSKTSEIPKVEAPAGNGSQAAADPGVVPDQLGTVKFGDAVKFTGTLQKIEDATALSTGNAFTNEQGSADASGSVQLVLRLDRPVDLTLGEKSYRLTTVAVAVNLSDNGASLIGRTAEVQGPLEESYATSWCPFGIKATHVNLTS